MYPLQVERIFLAFKKSQSKPRLAHDKKTWFSPTMTALMGALGYLGAGRIIGYEK
jgi:hypothetical protein